MVDRALHHLGSAGEAVKTVTVKVKCDGCRKPMPDPRECGAEYTYLHMVSHGYGLMDGDHRQRWDTCSPKCGVKMLKKFIKALESSE